MNAKIAKWLEGEVRHPEDADAMVVLRKLAATNDVTVGYCAEGHFCSISGVREIEGDLRDVIVADKTADDPADAIFAAADAYIVSLEKEPS